MTEEELNDLFPERDIDNQDTTPQVTKSLKNRTSALSAQIERFPSIPNNPFSEYARFDQRISVNEPQGVSVKRIIIFLTMLPEKERNYPMEVVIQSSARVQDLIGLICWQYTNENREPKLKQSVNHYCLRIAEENGEVDPDFPPLRVQVRVALLISIFAPRFCMHY